MIAFDNGWAKLHQGHVLDVLAAMELGRRCIGGDLSMDYIAMAQKRLEGMTLPMVL